MSNVIAIVEDNDDSRLLLCALLDERYEVREYASGREALDGFRGAAPDLVIMDVSLPGMDGIEVLSRIRADAELHRLPVVALTAHAMAGDRERLLRAGFDEYLSKPIVDEGILYAAIQRLLDRPLLA